MQKGESSANLKSFAFSTPIGCADVCLTRGARQAQEDPIIQFAVQLPHARLLTRRPPRNMLAKVHNNHLSPVAGDQLMRGPPIGPDYIPIHD